MKKSLYILGLGAMTALTACTKTDFEEAYTNPATLDQATVEKQFSGMLFTNKDYVLPAYWNYFVVMRTTLTHYTQAVGWVNSGNQYIPGEAGTSARWNTFYAYLAQFRELEKVYATLDAASQKDFRIYKIAATIAYYDQTQKVVDLHGDIPWTKAGTMSANNGDYNASYPAYDKAIDIYTKMLDDLKAFSDELSTMTIPAGVLVGFKTQDIINKGDLTLWKKYCNSLRLRILTRVSGVASLQARATSEIAAILADATKYPVAAVNADNIQIKVFDLASPINSTGFRTGLEDWNGNLAGKVMIDHMKTNADPRLRAMFEPGASAGGVYTGVDPMAKSSDQEIAINAGLISIYNRSTLSRNQYFPGVLINAPEVSFLKAEYYLKAGNDAAAKTAYETGVRQSIEYYYNLRTLSNDNTAGALVPYTTAEVDAYLATNAVKWDGATTAAAKLSLIGTQKWIHYSVVQLPESWAEIRRLNYPAFSFEVDASNQISQPPVRWTYPSSEPTYNPANYEAVKANDKLTTKIFWDLN